MVLTFISVLRLYSSLT